MTPEREAAIREAASAVSELQQWFDGLRSCNVPTDPQKRLQLDQEIALQQARMYEAKVKLDRLVHSSGNAP